MHTDFQKKNTKTHTHTEPAARSAGRCRGHEEKIPGRDYWTGDDCWWVGVDVKKWATRKCKYKMIDIVENWWKWEMIVVEMQSIGKCKFCWQRGRLNKGENPF